MVFGITAFLMIGIVPKFKEVFDVARTSSCPALTQARPGHVATSCKDNWAWCFGGIVGADRAASSSSRGRKPGACMLGLASSLQRAGLRPAVPQGRRSRASARTFATLIKSRRADPRRARDRRRDGGQPRRSRRPCDDARESVRQGDTLSEPLVAEHGLPADGHAHDRRSARGPARSKRCSRRSPSSTTSRSRPTVKSLTTPDRAAPDRVMGVIVGGIVLAVFLPIFELQKQLAGGS